MRPQQIYTDTSVIGGCFDEEFAEDSNRLFELVRAGRLRILISPTVAEELRDAPERVQGVLLDLPEAAIDHVPMTEELITLRNAYIDEGIVGAQWRDDATHVAAATVAGADAIVSWNFRHIVRLDLIGRYNSVNERLGYPHLVIVTPLEVSREVDSED